MTYFIFAMKLLPTIPVQNINLEIDALTYENRSESCADLTKPECNWKHFFFITFEIQIQFKKIYNTKKSLIILDMEDKII